MDFWISGKTSLDIIFILKGSMKNQDTILHMTNFVENWVTIMLLCFATGNSFWTASTAFVVGKFISVEIFDTIAKFFTRFLWSRMVTAGATGKFQTDYICKISQASAMVKRGLFQSFNQVVNARSIIIAKKQHFSNNAEAISGAKFMLHGSWPCYCISKNCSWCRNSQK